MRDSILIIDDESNLRTILSATLEKAGYLVHSFESFSQAKQTLNQEDIDLVLTDLQMPGETGMDVLAYCKQYSPDLPVILITAYGTIERAIAALKAGAFDFVLKPTENDELFRIIEKAIQSRKRRRKEPELELMSALGVGPVPIPLFGNYPTTEILRRDVERVSKSGSATLIYGEVGSGKRSVAYEIHRRSFRARSPFIQLNVDAIPPVFQVTELFGTEKGSNPMSFFSKPGGFELAQGGTLVIEEIGALSVEAQNFLFNVLEQEYFSRVGGVKQFPLDLRIIATSSKSLSDAVKQGTFHVELFYRLSAETLSLTPLRDRKDDIKTHLVPYFIERSCGRSGRAKLDCSEEVLQWFQDQAWSGNLGELERKVEQVVNQCTSSRIEFADLRLNS